MRLTASVTLLAWIGAAPAQPAKPDEAAAIAAAMKRAELLASGPMRVIMEAGKVRRREGAGAAPEVPGALRAPTAGRLQSLQLIATVIPAALAPLPRDHQPVDLAAGLAVPPQPAATQLTADPGVPRLVSTVEPAIPPQVRLQAASTNSVHADLTLRADGTVAEVALLPPVPRAWQRYLREALLQWRYEPVAGGRVQRVHLVFQDP